MGLGGGRLCRVCCSESFNCAAVPEFAVDITGFTRGVDGCQVCSLINGTYRLENTYTYYPPCEWRASTCDDSLCDVNRLTLTYNSVAIRLRLYSVWESPGYNPQAVWERSLASAPREWWKGVELPLVENSVPGCDTDSPAFVYSADELTPGVAYPTPCDPCRECLHGIASDFIQLTIADMEANPDPDRYPFDCNLLNGTYVMPGCGGGGITLYKPSGSVAATVYGSYSYQGSSVHLQARIGIPWSGDKPPQPPDCAGATWVLQVPAEEFDCTNFSYQLPQQYAGHTPCYSGWMQPRSCLWENATVTLASL
jgi:hypothetical protein